MNIGTKDKSLGRGCASGRRMGFSLKPKSTCYAGGVKCKYYSEAEPSFIEGDVFRIVVPLDDAYSFDFGQNGQSNQSNHSA